MEEIPARMIPTVVGSLMLTTGNFSHSVRSSFGFASDSHFVQLSDPFLALIVPCGHLMQSQQHGKVISFLVPGKHSDEQKDTGFENLFHRKSDVFSLSLGIAFLSQVPTCTFLRYLSVADERWKFKMLYDADKASPNLSNCTFPVKPSKLTFLRYFCRSCPLTVG